MQRDNEDTGGDSHRFWRIVVFGFLTRLILRKTFLKNRDQVRRDLQKRLLRVCSQGGKRVEPHLRGPSVIKSPLLSFCGQSDIPLLGGV